MKINYNYKKIFSVLALVIFVLPNFSLAQIQLASLDQTTVINKEDQTFCGKISGLYDKVALDVTTLEASRATDRSNLLIQNDKDFADLVAGQTIIRTQNSDAIAKEISDLKKATTNKEELSALTDFENKVNVLLLSYRTTIDDILTNFKKNKDDITLQIGSTDDAAVATYKENMLTYLNSIKTDCIDADWTLNKIQEVKDKITSYKDQLKTNHDAGIANDLILTQKIVDATKEKDAKIEVANIALKTSLDAAKEALLKSIVK